MTTRQIGLIGVAVMMLAVGWAGRATAAPGPGMKCKAAKLSAAGKYGACRLGAEKKAVLKAVSPDYTKCDAKYATAWGKAETKYTTACPTSGDQGIVQATITDHTDDLRSHLDGGPLEGGAEPLQTGQTLSYVFSDDGTFQKGATRSYTDNGDGTVTDNKTGLMWEKLSRDGSIHDYGDTYTWFTAINTKIATLNSGSGFAGHTDWRLPNLNELHTLADYGRVDAAIDPVFNTACAPSCTVTTCSCTQLDFYWSSTTLATAPALAWLVGFGGGGVDATVKSDNYYVRTVRGGS